MEVKEKLKQIRKECRLYDELYSSMMDIFNYIESNGDKTVTDISTVIGSNDGRFPNVTLQFKAYLNCACSSVFKIHHKKDPDVNFFFSLNREKDSEQIDIESTLKDMEIWLRLLSGTIDTYKDAIENKRHYLEMNQELYRYVHNYNKQCNRLLRSNVTINEEWYENGIHCR